MLKKLMKYDLRAIGRFWWLIAVFTLLACAVEGALLRILHELLLNGSTVLAVISMTVFFLGMIAVLMTLPLTWLLVFYRFYRQLYTNIGYLTFSLPVSRKQILASKTLSAIIWTLLQLFVLGIGAAFVLFCASAGDGAYFDAIVFTRLLDWVKYLWNGIGAWTVVYAVELIVLMLVGIWIAVGFAQMCIAIGATVFKKYKILAAVVIYTVVSAVVVLFFDVLAAVSAVLLFDGFVDLLSVSSGILQCVSLAIILLIACVISASLAVFIHLVTLDRIERKLSLA